MVFPNNNALFNHVAYKNTYASRIKLGFVMFILTWKIVKRKAFSSNFSLSTYPRFCQTYDIQFLLENAKNIIRYFLICQSIYIP